MTGFIFQNGNGFFTPGQPVQLDQKRLIEISHLSGFRDRVNNSIVASRFTIGNIAHKTFTVADFFPETDEVKMDDNNGWRYTFMAEFVNHVPRIQAP